jgi:hypothetical protein
VDSPSNYSVVILFVRSPSPANSDNLTPLRTGRRTFCSSSLISLSSPSPSEHEVTRSDFNCGQDLQLHSPRVRERQGTHPSTSLCNPIRRPASARLNCSWKDQRGVISVVVSDESQGNSVVVKAESRYQGKDLLAKIRSWSS